MKKAATYLLFLALLSPFSSLHAIETDPPKTTTEIPAEVQLMINRVEEIKEMDKSSMSRVEKRELRKEMRVLKAGVRSSGNGLYLSVGAIIIIVLVLILIL
jgi:hypothetical protein